MTKQAAIKLGNEFTSTLPGMRRTILVLAMLINICAFYFLFVLPMMLSWSFGSRQELIVASSFSMWLDIIAVIVLIGFSILYFSVIKANKQPNRDSLYLTALQFPDDITLPKLNHSFSYVPLMLAPHERRFLVSTLQWQIIAPSRIKLINDLVLRSFSLFLYGGGIINITIPNVARHNNFVVIYLLFITLSILSFIVLATLAGINSHRLAVAVDNDGIMIRTFRWQHIPWSHIKTIAVLPHHIEEAEGISAESLCVIAATNGLLMWQIPAEANVDALRDTKEFISLAMQSTGLPLRDLTPLARFRDGIITRESDYAQLMQNQELISLQSRSKQPFFAGGVVALLLSLLLFFPMTHLMYDVLQPAYFASLPTHIHAQTPTFSYPSLSASTISQPSSRPDAYSIVGSDDGTYSVFPLSQGNVAIEALITVQGTGSGGIAARFTRDADQLPQACQLSIAIDQSWNASCSYATFDTVQGHSMAIHPGLNKILLIAHGIGYALYINDTYIGFMEDQYGIGAGLMGQVGLFCMGNDTTCTFSDVTIWQLTDSYDPFWL